MNRTPSNRKRVVIVGGGFAGLYTAKGLGNQDVDVTLIDRKNHHTFQPLLYQVASGVLSPNQITAPIRHVLHRARNIEVILDEVTGFDLDQRRVRLRSGQSLGYDTLVVAAGARHSYFGHEEWAESAPGLKTVEDATDIRRRILLAFERAEREQVLTDSHDPLTFAVIGGGPTGVELAGAIADIAKRIVAGDYKAIDTKQARVVLFEGSPRVLATFPPELSAKAQTQLEELGVEVRTGCHVTAVERGRILAGDEWTPVAATLWATGVAASPLGRMLSAEVDRAGRVPVSLDLSLPGHPEVYVIGDMASLRDANGRPVPGLGAAAMQMGQLTAKNILRDQRREGRTAFAYKDKGSMATIGKHRAVAQLGKLRFTGFPAWAMWGTVHVILLIGFRNRLTVLREWLWAYLTKQFTARLITGTDTFCLDTPDRIPPDPVRAASSPAHPADA